MSWCDKLASTPSVGIKLNNRFIPCDELLSAISPLLNPLVDSKGKPLFIIDKENDFSIKFTTEDGFSYGIESSRLFVEFRHKMRLKPISGSLPTLEMLSQPKPYTQMLSDISSRLCDVALLVKEIEDRTINRIGIISNTTVAETEAPPGFKKYLEYMTAPWGAGAASDYAINISTEIKSESKWTDSCIHNFNRSNDEDALMSIRLDWYREFNRERKLTNSSYKDIFEVAEKSAMEYFEEIAEGSRFDEEIIRTSS